MKTIVLSALFISLCSWLSAGSLTSRPNVILINADDLGIGLLGCYGQKLIKTPHLDRLAAEGMRFDNYYGGTLCAPARWSLLTGMHFGRKGAWEYNRPGLLIQMDQAKISEPDYQKNLNAYVHKTATSIPPEEVFLAQIAQKAGYTTAQFGKLDVGFLTNHDRVKRFGWDHYLGFYSHGRAHGFYPPYLWKDGKKVPLKGNTAINCGKQSEKGNGPVGSGGETYSQNIFLSRILDFIREHQDEPFFLYHSTQLPHGPVAIPELHPDYADHPTLSLAEKKYASMVVMLDDHVGLIMAELKKLGLDKNTAVFFTSDNGHELYYGPKPQKGKQLANGEACNFTDRKWRTSTGGDVFDGAGGRAGAKRSPWQGGVQCPMIVRWPGKIKAGSNTKLLSSHYDFMATLAELIGGKNPPKKDSLSYLPTLLGKEQNQTHNYIIIDNRFSQMGRTCLIGKDGWKLVEIDQEKDHYQLYNLNEDNEEHHDLSVEHPDRVKTLKAILHRELKSPRPDLTHNNSSQL